MTEEKNTKAKISYAGKTFFFEVVGDEIDRREFLKKCSIALGSIVFFSIALNNSNDKNKNTAEAAVCCYSDCYTNCYGDCHGNCGRKSW